MFSTVLSIRSGDGHSVATMHGELDLVDAAAVETALMAAADREPRIIVDLASLRFIDASGMAALARARRYARKARGDLLLAGPRPQMARLLATTAMAYGFSVHASVEEAVGGFRARLSLAFSALSPLDARSGDLRVKAGDAAREPGQDLLADLVGDDLGVARGDAVDGDLGDVGGVRLGRGDAAGHVGVHVADVQGGDPGALGGEFEAQRVS